MSEGVETTEAPAWLWKLERQREKLSRARLGHDSGAGAPCNTCGPKCPGLELHFWRKVCRACHCSQDVHDVPDDELASWAQFELLGTARSTRAPLPLIKLKGVSEDPVAVDWVPPDVAPDLAAEYLESLGELAPVAGSEGARRRRANLRQQLPPHDVAPAAASHASDAERADHAEYVARLRSAAADVGRVVRVPAPARLVEDRLHVMLSESERVRGAVEPAEALVARLAALDVTAPASPASSGLSSGSSPAQSSGASPAQSSGRGSEETSPADEEPPPPPPLNYATHPSVAAATCGGCGGALAGGAAAVRAARLAAPLWHGACFKCAACDELLADLVYVSVRGRPHCARDAAAALGVPRCAGCDELIFERPYTAAEGRAFHVRHFCCYRCDAPLGGGTYVPDADSGLPACLACYEAHVAERCRACAGPIAAEQQGVSWGALHWHAECFVCSGLTCARSLLSGKFVVKKDMPFCSVPCVRSRIPS